MQYILNKKKKLFQWAKDLHVPHAKNPNLSLTPELPHSLRYGFGLKSYLGKTRRPEYSEHGVPSNPVLGHCLLFHVSKKKLEKKAMNVEEMHRYGFIAVNPRILTEREITFHGGLPQKCLVKQIDLVVPNLHCKLDPNVWPTFTQKKVADFKNKLKNNPELEKRVRVENQIIETAIGSVAQLIMRDNSKKVPA